MPVHILMPALSPTMVEGNLTRWLKKVGDQVARGEVIAEVETDKATMEIEATEEGILSEILVLEGTSNVKVNAPIATLGGSGQAEPPLPAPSVVPANVARPQAAVDPVPSALSRSPAPRSVAANKPSGTQRRIAISPLARRKALEFGVEIDGLRGSGPRGRIVLVDVVGVAQKIAARSGSEPGRGGGFTAIKPSNMRSTIAMRVTGAKQTIPHFYLTIDCNVDAALDLRRTLNSLPDAARRLSITDLVIRASALALKKVPDANSSWYDGEIRQWDTADIAIAVALESGLITPIVRQAESKSVTEISAEMERLVSAAKTGQLRPEEFQGGTFSISNLGMYGISQFEAIINPPHAAILAVGACERRPIVKGDDVAIATMMTCTFSGDHRVIDGAGGALFLSEFRKFIESPLTLMI